MYHPFIFSLLSRVASPNLVSFFDFQQVNFYTKKHPAICKMLDFRNKRFIILACGFHQIRSWLYCLRPKRIRGNHTNHYTYNLESIPHLLCIRVFSKSRSRIPHFYRSHNGVTMLAKIGISKLLLHFMQSSIHASSLPVNFRSDIFIFPPNHLSTKKACLCTSSIAYSD